MTDSQVVGLTPAQAQSLLFVRYTKSFMASVGHLAATLGSTHATTVGVIDGLVARGLVRKAPSELDGRVTLLRLTPSGEQACQGLERWAHTLEEGLTALAPAELAALERGLGGVIFSLRAAGPLVVFEPCPGLVYFRENAAPGSPEPHRCDLISGFLSEPDARLACPDFTPLGLDAPPIPGHATRAV